ncbi:hypothetical protein CPB85DRAFT_1248806 [Mucidula mucida]|nr:hypothetical protein CPB85DRAFT_1248806 [Mucidula mucida]
MDWKEGNIPPHPQPPPLCCPRCHPTPSLRHLLKKQFHPYSYPSFTYNSYTPSTAASHFAGRKWCEQNGLEADKGTGRPQRPKDSGKKKAKKAGNKKVQGTREVKPLPTCTIARRRASLASIKKESLAATYTVGVGKDEVTGHKGEGFDPSAIFPLAGNTIVFEFRSGSHSVIVTSFDKPCTPSNGFNSGVVTIVNVDASGLLTIQFGCPTEAAVNATKGRYSPLIPQERKPRLSSKQTCYLLRQRARIQTARLLLLFFHV